MGLIRILAGLLIDLVYEIVFTIRASFGIFPFALQLLLVGGFLYWILTRYWWKKDDEKK